MLALSAIKDVLRSGPYAWPGGYPIYFVTCDGDALSFEAVRAEFRQVCHAHLTDNRRDGWALCGYDVNWEDGDLTCAHTGKRIESAYAD